MNVSFTIYRNAERWTCALIIDHKSEAMVMTDVPEDGWWGEAYAEAMESYPSQIAGQGPCLLINANTQHYGSLLGGLPDLCFVTVSGCQELW